MRDQVTPRICYGDFVTEETVPNMEFLHKHDLEKNAPPHMWMNVFLPYKKSKEQISEDGPFTIVYFIHDLSPSPHIEYLMQYQIDNPWNRNDMVANAL